MSHKDVLKSLMPIKLGGVFEADIKIEGKLLDEAQASAELLLREMLPQSAAKTIEDWERICGITPGDTDTLQMRQVAVISRLRETGGLSFPYLSALAKPFGYLVELEEMLANTDGYGAEGIFRWGVTFYSAPFYYFRAGQSRAGERLIDGAAADALEGLFEDLKPAHTLVSYTYVANQISAGSVALADTGISYIDGLAFVGLAGVDLSIYAGRYIIITDSAGKKAEGWIKKAGSGETLGSSLVIDGAFEIAQDFSPTYLGKWIEGSNTQLTKVAGGRSGYCGETTRISSYLMSAGTRLGNNFSTPVGGLFELTGYAKSGTADSITINISIARMETAYGFPTTKWLTTDDLAVNTSWQALSVRGNSLYSSSGIIMTEPAYAYGASSSVLYDDIAVKQILSPPATGALIVSERAGNVCKWETIETGFNYKSIGGYTYAIYHRKPYNN